MESDLTPDEFKLVNSFQRDFPLVPRPFAKLAAEVGMDESTVIETLQRLQAAGTVGRVGAVFRPNAIGASALAALAVPADRLDEVARYVSAFAEVNHNYQREHRFNLWFVATAHSVWRLRAVMREIQEECQCGTLLVLPMLEDFHIDLGFDLTGGPGGHADRVQESARAFKQPAVALRGSEKILVSALQGGLPLVERPFACLGLPEGEAIAAISQWLEQGVIKRFGVIVRHHELGYTSNAMVVWDVPDDEVSAAGRRIAASGRVTLCYRRTRQLPDWRYNLFCMIHGKDRADVEAQVQALTAACELDAYPNSVLFSCRRFKQRGAHYAALTEVSHGRD
ncbi:Lrp/AsnC family transcriptional regulator [Noviherbaspirillum sp. UKPF54]|uniref:siroheme decarboxylase subunit beta n=1 Tax=Noviherbaspirillum sp. UKPF54 TaxID=2601898 RepID=UPI0011B1B394|nr:Lrp/AsnC family transcriptional regulator [Noviherbaspirillum sp. UKPF54]QDZ28975.1 Lrp/AsnC family transcriptional regulator [Noviherbaspirillum sp. UKPF54]